MVYDSQAEALKALAALTKGHCGEQVQDHQLILFNNSHCPVVVAWDRRKGWSIGCTSPVLSSYFDTRRSAKEVWAVLRKEIVPKILEAITQKEAALANYHEQWDANRQLLQQLAKQAGLNPKKFAPTKQLEADRWHFRIGVHCVDHCDEDGICFDIRAASAPLAKAVVALLMDHTGEKGAYGAD